MLNAHNVLIRIADTHHTVHTVHAITTQNETTQYCRSEHYPCSLQLPGGNSHGRNPKEITVNFDMFDKTPEEKTAEANKVAKSFGISDSALAEVEEYKAKLTRYNAWDLPFMGYVNEDGYGYAYAGCRHRGRTLLGCPQGVPCPAGGRAGRVRDPYAVHPPPGRPLRRQHVPPLPARFQGELHRRRRQQVLIGRIPERNRTLDHPSYRNVGATQRRVRTDNTERL